MDVSASQQERFSRAVEYETTGNHMLAEQEYLTLLQDSVPYRPALINLGSLYSRLNRYEEAMNCYGRAIELEEDYLSWFNIGSIYYRKGDYKQAVIALEQSRRINDNFTLPVLAMGLSYSKLGNVKAAEQCFLDILNKVPDNEVALTGLAILYFDRGNLHQALDMADRLLLIKSSHCGMKKLRAKILLDLGRSAESAKVVKEIRSDDNGFAGFDSLIGSVPERTFNDRYGSIDEKISMLEEKTAEGESPGDMIALSLCHLFNGNPDKAIDCLFQAKDLNT